MIQVARTLALVTLLFFSSAATAQVPEDERTKLTEEIRVWKIERPDFEKRTYEWAKQASTRSLAAMRGLGWGFGITIVLMTVLIVQVGRLSQRVQEGALQKNGAKAKRPNRIEEAFRIGAERLGAIMARRRLARLAAWTEETKSLLKELDARDAANGQLLATATRAAEQLSDTALLDSDRLKSVSSLLKHLKQVEESNAALRRDIAATVQRLQDELKPTTTSP